VIILFYSLSFFTLPVPAYASDDTDHVVKVYNFHRRFRCPECVKTEYIVHKALKRYFSYELESGEITWQVIDVSIKRNQHYLADYGFIYNTVIVVDERSGKDVRFKNLEKIYDIMEDEEASVEFVRREVEEYLSSD
jgi:hypothetical protein